MLVVDDLSLEFAKIVNPFVDTVGVMLEEFEQSWKDPSVRSMYLIDVLKLLHFGEGQAQVLEPLDEFQPLVIPICIDPFSALHPLYGIEKANLFVIPDRSRGETYSLGQFADRVMCRILHEAFLPPGNR